MKKGLMVILPALCFLMCGDIACAKEADTIKTGVYADHIELSGKTKEEAVSIIEAYVDELRTVEVTLQAVDGKEVVKTADELGIAWTNRDLVDEAMELGTEGNVIRRYKALKDLAYENKIYTLEFGFDIQKINDILLNECSKYDREAEDVSLKRVDGEFQIVEGITGYLLDVESSIDTVNDYLTLEWNREPCTIVLDVTEDLPQGSAEELANVTDVLGTFTTSYVNSGFARQANVENGAVLIDGITLYPGEEFSTYETVAPFTEANGYYPAGSYMNGKVVDSLGGGICQVSTTLYNAALLAELDITERHNHSMVVSYVNPSEDAAIAESAGKDFRFVNNREYPIYIEAVIKNKHITFNIYGKETRPENRTVRYESEILEVNYPPADSIYPDSTQPIGYIVTESAHIGYKARLWKIVTEDGVEVSREQVNKSSYKMVPRSATVGTNTADPLAYEEIMAAIGTANIDHVKNVIAILTNQNGAVPPAQ